MKKETDAFRDWGENMTLRVSYKENSLLVLDYVIKDNLTGEEYSVVSNGVIQSLTDDLIVLSDELRRNIAGNDGYCDARISLQTKKVSY